MVCIGYGKRSNARSKAGSQNLANYDSSKMSSFKLMNKCISKNRMKDRLSHSGSTKHGRPTTGQIAAKKKLKIAKGKIAKPKEISSSSIWIQNQNNAAKNRIKIKSKLEKEECSIKDEHGKKNAYDFASPDPEPLIKNLIKLHLPAEKRDMMSYHQNKKFQRNSNKLHVLFNSSKSSTNDSTYHKSRANSNETRKGNISLAGYKSSKNSGNHKVNSLNRKPIKIKSTQKNGNKTNRNRMKVK